MVSSRLPLLRAPVGADGGAGCKERIVIPGNGEAVIDAPESPSFQLA
jgi:hypothetical protein